MSVTLFHVQLKIFVKLFEFSAAELRIFILYRIPFSALDQWSSRDGFFTQNPFEVNLTIVGVKIPACLKTG
jgi:hypothetical protein